MSDPQSKQNDQIPISTVTGIIKKIDSAQIGEEGRHWLNICFPEFLFEEDRLASLREAYIRFEYTKHQTIPVQWGRMRRYAGSPSLGIGRYYSVCYDNNGADGGAMLNELMSYWSERTMVYPRIADTTLISDKDKARFPDLKAPQLIIRAKEYYWHKSFLGKLSLKESPEKEISLPLTVTEIRLNNVIDLRLPKTQEWFYKKFVTLEDEINKRAHPEDPVQVTVLRLNKCRNFIELLPTLVFPGIGGSSFHQAVGAWFRSHGINGFIFPSARCNCYSRIMSNPEATDKKKQLFLSFYGWNFVDYRNTGATDWESLFGRLPSWAKADTAGIKIKEYKGEEYGWEIANAEEGEKRRVQLAFDIMTGKIKPPSGWDSRDGFRRPYYERQ